MKVTLFTVAFDKYCRDDNNSISYGRYEYEFKDGRYITDAAPLGMLCLKESELPKIAGPIGYTAIALTRKEAELALKHFILKEMQEAMYSVKMLQTGLQDLLDSERA